MLNSRHPLVCAPSAWLPKQRASLSRSYGGRLPSSFSIVRSSALVCSTSPPVSVSGTVFVPVLFPGSPRPPAQSTKSERLSAFVTPSRPGNVHPVPISYGFRPRLRGRLTLRGLTLRRNPWTFGVRVSHPHYRYSCQHSHFRCLQQHSHATFTGLRNAPLPRARPKARPPAASVRGFSPVTSSARDSLTRPVSYYAFFKGWLLLSQPPGCLGRPTSFPT